MRSGTEAVILAGGKSTRMGTNKALLRLSAGGPTMIERVVTRLREAGWERPLIVTNSPDEYSFLELPTAPDTTPGAGPLAGILAGLRHQGGARCLVVACDMPLLSPRLLRYMVELAEDATDYDAVVPVAPDGDTLRPQVLHAIYTPLCATHIQAMLDAGDKKVGRLLNRLEVRYIEPPRLRQFDPDLQSFLNVNTHEQWAELEGTL